MLLRLLLLPPSSWQLRLPCPVTGGGGGDSDDDGSPGGPGNDVGGGMDMMIMTIARYLLTSLVSSVAAVVMTMEAVATRTMTTMGPPITAMARAGDPPAMMVGSSGRSTCDTPAR